MTSNNIYTLQFCTYLTSYSGNKLPPFYIGSSSTERISSEEGLIYRKDLSDKMTGEGNPQFGKTGEQATCFGRTGELHPLFGKTGELSPNFGKKRSDEVKLSISINHADVSGSNNPRAKSWKLTSPQGIEYYCKGNIETIVEEHNLGISSLKNV